MVSQWMPTIYMLQTEMIEVLLYFLSMPQAMWHPYVRSRANSTLEYPWGIAVDENRIYVTIAGGHIAAFPINASGDVAPTRLIQGDLTSLYNPAGIAVVPSPITLTSPAEQAPFDACSLYSLPTFAWNATEPFKSYEIQFSPSDPLIRSLRRSKRQPRKSDLFQHLEEDPTDPGGKWRIRLLESDRDPCG